MEEGMDIGKILEICIEQEIPLLPEPIPGPEPDLAPALEPDLEPEILEPAEVLP